jgi:hypothetical protein
VEWYLNVTISDILTPRDEVVDREFQGVLHAHKVGSDSGDRLETDPDRLLSMTYPSNALLNVFDRVDDKLQGRDSQGGILLTGPYGSGKSHGLLTLYHMFDAPGAGQQFIDEWDIDLDLPDTADATVLSTSETDADYIWDPIFRDLGREGLLDDIDRYPTTDHIEELVGDDNVAIFFDEIETWWGSFGPEEDEQLLNRNEFFLQNLLEVANDPDHDLFVFITLLDKNQDIRRILDRTNPYDEDLNTTGDRERIILHRLFETGRDEIDESAVRDIVENYVENYSPPIQLDESKRFENRMVETYPFHPNLLDLLDSIYEAARERQNVRGAMNVLAETVRQNYRETDLLITCDVSPRAFRGINRTLFNRYSSDLDTVDDIEFGEDLLRTILLYTLDHREQMASVTNALLGTYKPSKTTVDQLHMSLESLYGTAHYLDRDSSKENYHITEDPKLTALVTREQERALDSNREAIEETLVDVVRNDVWDGNVHIYPEDDIPDNDSISVVVTLEKESNGSLKDTLDDFYDDHKYANTYLFVTPKKEVRNDTDIIRKAARVLGAENLRGKVDDEKGELESLIRDERRELRNELESRYGKWVKWTQNPRTGNLGIRRMDVEASVSDVRNKVGSDKTYVGEEILAQIDDAPSGIPVGSMLNDFKQFRKMPVLVDDEVFYSAVRKLHRDEAIVLEGDRARYYVAEHDEYPSEISDELTIHDPDDLPESVFEEEDEGEGDGGEVGTEGEKGGTTTTVTSGSGDGGTSVSSTTTAGGTTTTGTDDGGTTVTTETTKVELEGNKARVLRSMAESRVNEETDTATKITLDYDVDDLSKSELIELLEQLPSADEIAATVVIERETEE